LKADPKEEDLLKKCRQPQETSSFETDLSKNKKRLAIWISILAQTERKKGNLKLADDLSHSVSFLTNKEGIPSSSETMLDILLSTEPSWFQQHYRTLSEKIDLIGVCYVLEKAHRHYVTADAVTNTNIQAMNLKIQENLAHIL
jgi:hypothetical protein